MVVARARGDRFVVCQLAVQRNGEIPAVGVFVFGGEFLALRAGRTRLHVARERRQFGRRLRENLLGFGADERDHLDDPARRLAAEREEVDHRLGILRLHPQEVSEAGVADLAVLGADRRLAAKLQERQVADVVQPFADPLPGRGRDESVVGGIHDHELRIRAAEGEVVPRVLAAVEAVFVVAVVVAVVVAQALGAAPDVGTERTRERSGVGDRLRAARVPVPRLHVARARRHVVHAHAPADVARNAVVGPCLEIVRV